MILDEILNTFPNEEMEVVQGFDICVIGYDYGLGDSSPRLIYSVKKIIDKMIKDGFTEVEAIELFEQKIRSVYSGDCSPSPIFCQDDL